MQDLFLDDCFVGLNKNPAGETVAEIVDPVANYGVRIIATAPEVTAIQVYAPVNRNFIALEPQLNWADPYSCSGRSGQGFLTFSGYFFFSFSTLGSALTTT